MEVGNICESGLAAVPGSPTLGAGTRTSAPVVGGGASAGGGKVEEEPRDAATSARTSGGILAKFTVTAVDAAGKPLSPPKPLPHSNAKGLAAGWLRPLVDPAYGQLGPRPLAPKAVEAMSPQPDNAVYTLNGKNLLVQAVYTAFYKHHPLRLGPDIIWLTIAQGLANHVNNNAEALRKKFVTFEGKKNISVTRPEFVKGSPANNWAGVFPEFSDKIAAYIGKDKRDLIECNFSTTSPIDKICSHITLMDTVKSYFRYVLFGGCGLPEIQLTGTVADWKAIRTKAEQLRQFDLDWWLKELLPVLDQFVAAAEGRGAWNTAFWRSMCNKSGGSGSYGGPVTGWVQVFFPYLKKGRKNTCLGEWRKDNGDFDPPKGADGRYPSGATIPSRGYSIKLEDFPASASAVPFVYVDMHKPLTGDAAANDQVATAEAGLPADAGEFAKYQMKFAGGIVAITQDPETLTLEPRTGWAVLDYGDFKAYNAAMKRSEAATKAEIDEQTRRGMPIIQ